MAKQHTTDNHLTIYYYYSKYFCSHVMTFFDRKVDLAQFPPDHPLYVMCRAWMRNDPSGSEEPERPTSPQACRVMCMSI